ncbi:hypothetical protein PGT21_016387 [Puccinia graminis f. sp. tritici]|uniref:Tet-like 2OG-Fe(II) oxygenase domain-containing protein n=1 Tax=Puccinia graminis f. sp. tritici TaxID=56615 RepID=A0A5B0M461_PUCGR|nr:hypothetical protein PGT21_016387 [Puccinia graminis f. sp. tritici]KAA1089832.1 hypothetical protein PGTUg99_021380 [Puccinia graminis f. sp. tritici]
MSRIGFQGGYEHQKTAGFYTWCDDVTPKELQQEQEIQRRLVGHDLVMQERVQHFSQSAFQENQKILREHGIPGWNDDDWNNASMDPLFSNLVITTNDSSNTPHV